MLARRTQVADEITKTIDALGRLVAEELDLQGQLRRIAEADILRVLGPGPTQLCTCILHRKNDATSAS